MAVPTKAAVGPPTSPGGDDLDPGRDVVDEEGRMGPERRSETSPDAQVDGDAIPVEPAPAVRHHLPAPCPPGDRHAGPLACRIAMGSLIKKRRKRMRKKKHKKMLKATRWQRRAGK